MFKLPLGLLCALELAVIFEKFVSGGTVMCIDLPSLHMHYSLAYH
jgi:hypothetical protein